MKVMMALIGFVCTYGAVAATFTGDLYAFWYGDKYDCGLYKVEPSWKAEPTWRSDYVEVDGNKEPALFGWDAYAFPVAIAPGETFAAEVIHGTSTASHIKSVKVLSDAQMYAKFKDSDEWEDGEGESARESMVDLWNDGAVSTRAWIVVEQRNVTSGATCALDLARLPIVNLARSASYNPSDGDGGLSSKWTVASYAKKFGVTLSGVRKLTASVWYKVGIKGGAAFPRRVWHVCDPFQKDGSKLEAIEDNGGDEEVFDVPGLFFISPDMVGGGSGGVAIPTEWQKTRTLIGAATRALPEPYNVRGVFAIKCGKANKKGVAKVSATLTGIDGKKTKYKARSVTVAGGQVEVDFGGLSVSIDGESFAGNDGMPGGLSVASADVGGNWTRTGANVYVDATYTALPAGTLEALLPDGEPVIAKSGKWAFNKAASVKLSKDKSTAEWNTSNGKTNLSAIKLAYMPKTGLFKGSFKLYALEGASGGNKKLKKYSAKVTGVVVDGNGFGQASVKKPALGPWAVTVR